MVDLLSFKSSLSPALLEAVLDVKESNDHILVDMLPTAVETMVAHLKSKKGFCIEFRCGAIAVLGLAPKGTLKVIKHSRTRARKKTSTLRKLFGNSATTPPKTGKVAQHDPKLKARIPKMKAQIPKMRAQISRKTHKQNEHVGKTEMSMGRPRGEILGVWTRINPH